MPLRMANATPVSSSNTVSGPLGVSVSGGTLTVNGSMTAFNVTLSSGVLNGSGTINGPVHATETLELQAGSRVKGDVYYKTIEIHQGAVVEGRLVHHAAVEKAVELKLASST